MTIEEAKNNLLLALESIDKDKLSLGDLQLYANILRTISEIQTKSYMEILSDKLSSGFGMKPSTVSDLK